MTPQLRLLCGLLLALGFWGGTAAAHVTELAVLRIAELSAGTYTVSWEMKPNTQANESFEPIFPEHCTYAAPTLDCGSEGLVGALSFEGIGAGQSAAMFKIRAQTGETQIYTLSPTQPVANVTPAYAADTLEGKLRVSWDYLILGIEHILKGIDHLLFVLGLVWIARGWMLFNTITAFTVAHSITLALVTFGFVGVPELYVNALIALSIVFVGVEVIRAQQGRSSFTLRHPWIVAFGFGLLHGMGFANALVALGLPSEAVPYALVAFNLGVEAGQIAFVLGVIALAWAYRVMRVQWPNWSLRAPAYAIGGLAAFWFVERVAVMVGA
ncbi:MAG: HupE/UreJ family protein [Paracoccaceae bacterium]